MKIIPAILTEDFSTLKDMIELSATFTNHVQVDVMDGKFVPSISITASDLDNANAKKLFMEIHLMVDRPSDVIEDFVKAGAKKIIFHIESKEDPHEIINTIKKYKVIPSVAINPDTKIEKLDTIIDEIDSILFMTVFPGFYGSPLVPEVFEKIKKFKSKHPNIEIAVDGGVKVSNIDDFKKYPIDAICVGSAIFKAKNPKDIFIMLQEKTN